MVRLRTKLRIKFVFIFYKSVVLFAALYGLRSTETGFEREIVVFFVAPRDVCSNLMCDLVFR